MTTPTYPPGAQHRGRPTKLTSAWRSWRARHSVRREVAPHHQVQLLWVLTVLVVVALVITGSLTLSSAQRNINTATTQLVPASTALGTAIHNYGAGSTALENLVQSPHPGALAAGADQLTALNNAAVTAWKNYERASVNLPGEAKLRDTVNQETEQISQQGVALLSNPSAASSAVAAFASLSDQKQQDLTAIQNLYQTRINAVVASTNRSFQTRTNGLLPVLATVLVLTIIAFGIVIASIRRRYRRPAR